MCSYQSLEFVLTRFTGLLYLDFNASHHDQHTSVGKADSNFDCDFWTLLTGYAPKSVMDPNSPDYNKILVQEPQPVNRGYETPSLRNMRGAWVSSLPIVYIHPLSYETKDTTNNDF